MENNVELIKSLFVDIDPSIINNDKLDGLVDILDKQITSIMKAFLGLFKEDMRILSETDNKKLIK